jgi:hypothetical protein
MADVIIDIEQRLELAVRELLLAYANLTTLVTTSRVYLSRDTSHAVDYPCATIHAISFSENGMRTGWYKGSLQLAALTYREDDKSRATLKTILGALRGWGQQTGLAASLNATAAAKATATALSVADIWLEGPSVDESLDNVQEEFVTLAVVCRPSQAKTT